MCTWECRNQTQNIEYSTYLSDSAQKSQYQNFVLVTPYDHTRLGKNLELRCPLFSGNRFSFSNDFMKFSPTYYHYFSKNVEKFRFLPDYVVEEW